MGIHILLWVALIMALILFSILAITRLRYLTIRRRLRITRKKNLWMGRFIRLLCKSKIMKRCLENLAVKVGMLNGNSFEKNLEYAVIVMLASLILFIAFLIVILPQSMVLWYILLGYVVIALTFLAVLFTVFGLTVKQRFTNRLPQTFKVLNSRYIVLGNIQKAISISMDDFDRTVRREMRRIYNVLQKNDIKEIDNTFLFIEGTYRNEYLTLLLSLIRQAYYKGGDEAIKRQFEQTTEEILLDIENQKDLSSTSRMYVFLALLLPFGVWWLESFNKSALGTNAVEFYSSPIAIEVKIVFYFAFLIFIGVMLFMERTS